MANDFDFSNSSLQSELNRIDSNRPAELEAHVYDGGVEITHLVVSGPARNRGVARSMIQEVLTKSRAAGVRSVTVITQGGDPAAALFRDMGFSVSREQVSNDDDIVTGVLDL